MGRKKDLTEIEKSMAIAWKIEDVSVSEIARRLGRGKSAIYSLLNKCKTLPILTTPKRKPGSGGLRKTSKRTDCLIGRLIKKNPFMSAAEVKASLPELLENVSERTIRHRLSKDLGFPSRRAAKKNPFDNSLEGQTCKICHMI